MTSHSDVFREALASAAGQSPAGADERARSRASTSAARISWRTQGRLFTFRGEGTALIRSPSPTYQGTTFHAMYSPARSIPGSRFVRGSSVRGKSGTLCVLATRKRRTAPARAGLPGQVVAQAEDPVDRFFEWGAIEGAGAQLAKQRIRGASAGLMIGEEEDVGSRPGGDDAGLRGPPKSRRDRLERVGDRDPLDAEPCRGSPVAKGRAMDGRAPEKAGRSPLLSITSSPPPAAKSR